MALHATATTLVQSTSQEVLEFVLDLDRYRQADTKIRKVTKPVVLDDHHRGSTRYWGRLRWLPAAPDTNLVALTPWSRLTFTGAPRQPARLFMNFIGTFECCESDGGCEITHSYEMRFRGPFRWLYEPLVRTWLQHELEDELARLGNLLDEGPARS
jgi:hypothetical protein